MSGTVAATALQYGTGSLNIDASRIGTTDEVKTHSRSAEASKKENRPIYGEYGPQETHQTKGQALGRWPANVILSAGAAVVDLDEQSGVHQNGSGTVKRKSSKNLEGNSGTAYGAESRPEGSEMISYGDTGGASRYFKLVLGITDLIEYLRTMLSTPDAAALVVGQSNWHHDRTGWADASLCGLVLHPPGRVTAEEVADFHRLLLPGGHLVLIAPDDQPTGHSGAILLEDAGFELRDAILWVREAGRLHYVAKAPRAEREAGCAHLEGKAGHEAVDRKEGTAGVLNPRAGAGRTAAHVKNHHPCLHPDALVMTDRGYRPIHQIEEGHMVYGEDGQFHPVDAVSSHPYTSEDLFKIEVKGTNYTTLASDNHPFLIWRPVRKGKSIVGGGVVWVEASGVRKGDYTMTPVLRRQATRSRVFTEDYWWVFGLWIAEGVLQRSGPTCKSVYPSYTLHEDETVFVDRLRRFFEPRGSKVSVYPKKGGKAVQVVCFDAEIGKYFSEQCPTGAANKRLPLSIWWWNQTCQRALFEGYMAGDGGKVNTYRQAKTVSPDLASQIRFLGEGLGTKANLFRYAAQPGGIGDRKFKTTLPSYQVRFYDRDMNQTSRKPTRPTTVEHLGTTFRLSYVQKITPVPYKDDVWNLTVKESSTFQTAVGMSHNTVKPIAVMERLLMDVPVDEGPVIDPFMGSGTTAVACVKTGHDFTGIERKEDYLAIADARARHWDSAHHGWIGADIVSDLVVDITWEKALSLDDLFE